MKKDRRKYKITACLSGGDDRDRTDYLLNAIQALYQVSYAPVFTVLLYHKSAITARDLNGIFARETKIFCALLRRSLSAARLLLPDPYPFPAGCRYYLYHNSLNMQRFDKFSGKYIGNKIRKAYKTT